MVGELHITHWKEEAIEYMCDRFSKQKWTVSVSENNDRAVRRQSGRRHAPWSELT